MIYVTHDQVEAMTMADKIVVLDAGYVAQVGKPLELYHYPDNRFVAGFIGSPKMNFMSVFIDEVEAERVKVQLSDGDSFWIPVDGTTVNKGDVCLWVCVQNTLSLKRKAMLKLKAKL